MNGNEYPKNISGRYKEYLETGKELDGTKKEKDDINNQYDEELALHNTLKLENEGNGEYPFEEEHSETLASQENELTPLNQKERQLVAKLRRLRSLDHDEANAHNRRLERLKMLPGLREMQTEINAIKREMSTSHTSAFETIIDACTVIQLLKDFVVRKDLTPAEEKEVEENLEKLVELYGKLTELQHNYVHTDFKHLKK